MDDELVLIEELLTDEEVRQIMEANDNRRLTYDMMVWWRHICKVRNIMWITTKEERQIEEEARTECIQTLNHARLQHKFFSYESSDSSDNEGETEDNQNFQTSESE